MKDFENLMITVLKQKPLSQEQIIFARHLADSGEPFERFVGKLTEENSYSHSKCAFNPSDYYAQEALFRLFQMRSSAIINNVKIKQFIFKAAKSKRVPARINATQVLAKIAKREPKAYSLLRELKSDKNELVRHNARILLNELSPRYSSRHSALASAKA